VVAARDKLLVTMRKMKAGAERSIRERQAAAEAAEARAAQLAAEGAALKSRIQVSLLSALSGPPPCGSLVHAARIAWVLDTAQRPAP
jgi:hypothetical protein